MVSTRTIQEWDEIEVCILDFESLIYDFRKFTTRRDRIAHIHGFAMYRA